jgi:penicillin-binding protein 1C
LFYLFWNILSPPLFNNPTSTVIVTEKAELLAARIADDGQWRFPQSDSVPEKFQTAIKYFEDEYFNYHLGVNPVSFIRALKQNITEGKVVSGASTITMQTIRLSRKGQYRTYFEKFIEMILATRLELSKSKKSIMNLYASNAPFGGNVVGLDAASWRYYKRASYQLSWGETATLAVLPNAPSLIFPGRNHHLLLQKRNRLLQKLMENGEIDSLTCELAKLESLPSSPHPLPRITPHLLNRLIKEGYKGKICKVSIDKRLQTKLNTIVKNAHDELRYNSIHNASILVIDVKEKKVISYVGNSSCRQEGSGSQVDMITSARSTGSTLKPFLYASILDEGSMMPHSLVPDIPTQILSFSPKNFYRTYDGAVSASNALVRSLNVPAVLQLSNYSQQRFYDKLKQLNIKSLNKNAKHYGLSLILGGSEANMWELGRTYMGMASSLNNYEENNYKYDANDYDNPTLITTIKNKRKNLQKDSHFSAASIWQTFEVLSELNRPIGEGQWEVFSSSSKIAWKTGTSFGHRDAWAIGVTPEYVAVVWVGNADGEGRPGLTGTNIAAPIMFSVFDQLPATTWFNIPYEDMEELEVCTKSGDLASENCENISIELVPKNCKRAKQCIYHKIIHLNLDSTHKVNSDCYKVSEMQHISWFTLPPMMAYYYKKVNPFYAEEPELHQDCVKQSQESMQMIYPKNGSKLFLPRNLDGSLNQIVFKMAHSKSDALVYWHLDEKYVGQTKGYHNRELFTSIGNHTLTIVDTDGNEIKVNFEIIDIDG